ncbi:MAG: penicillin-binding protein 1C [Fusobacteriaceae bacterium]|jgi:penicillin-binding protein 1C|nr:penicillin-binding protein 1C [Fusobacteriaceae bacterium]
MLKSKKQVHFLCMAIIAGIAGFLFLEIRTLWLRYDIPALLKNVEHSYSPALLDKNDRILSVQLNEKQQWHIKSPENVPENLKAAVLTYEDKNFYRHRGVDIPALLRALRNNWTGRRKSGASTITMQVVKVLSPGKRTYLNKIKEIIAAVKLDASLTKDEILSLYLNNAPYGGNITGYGTASRLYFEKSPGELSWGEAALLAVLPNAPGLINVEKNRDLLLSKRNDLLKRLHGKGLIRENLYQLSLREPLPEKIHPFPRIAPHLLRRLTENADERMLRSTIDGYLQQRLEEVCRTYADFMKNEGIANLALLVIENQTRAVRAYVGSQDFLDFANHGQVDGITARRSPGSVLKPFLYALAMDAGLVAPQSLLPDVPLYFSNFKPRNANARYNGMIQIRLALIRSLNIPFVRLLEEYGYERFYYFLKNALGFGENDPDRYGLSLILGTKEFSMEDMGVLYAGLADYGNFQPLRYLRNREKDSPAARRLISPGAAWLTLQTIKELERPGYENFYKWKNPISWKTGTSYGRKDGWACGVTPEYTVIVWTGNFTGKGNPNLSGIVSGGRLLFNVFNELVLKYAEFKTPPDLKKVEVDARTGYRPAWPGMNVKEIDYPADALPLKASPYYKKIYVNAAGEEIDSRDPAFAERREKIAPNYPLEVINYLIRENIETDHIFDPGLKNTPTLKILYPAENATILLPRDFDGEKELIVKIANIKEQDVYWYLDNRFLGVDSVYEKRIKTLSGTHTLTIMGENGEIRKTRFTIKRTTDQ